MIACMVSKNKNYVHCMYNHYLTAQVNHITLEYIPVLLIRFGNSPSIRFEISVLSSRDKGLINFATMLKASIMLELAFLAARSSAAFFVAMI